MNKSNQVLQMSAIECCSIMKLTNIFSNRSSHDFPLNTKDHPNNLSTSPLFLCDKIPSSPRFSKVYCEAEND